MNNIFKSGAGECSKCRQLPCDWLKDIGKHDTKMKREPVVMSCCEQRQRTTDTYSKAIKSVASSAARRVAHFRIFFFLDRQERKVVPAGGSLFQAAR